MKKIIGLTCQNEYQDNKWVQTINQDYITAIEQVNAVAILLPVSENDIDDKVNMIDGLVIIGGFDINPQMYTEINLGYVDNYNKIRDEYEKALIMKCIQKNIPILGICRGMQTINITLGGTLYQDNQLYTDHQPQTLPRHVASHSINIMEDSFLYSIYNNKGFVNSFHHQSIKDLGTGLKVAALSDDGVIEAIQHHSLPIYGVQWHPESMQLCNQSREIFQNFIEEIK